MQFLVNDDNFWENVIFSDEKVFQSSHNGKVKVFRPPQSRFNETYTKKDNSSGRFSVNVWAWISSRGPGVCWKIDGRLNGQAYAEILENVFLPSANLLFENNDFIFQQDNCPVHRCRIVQNCLFENEVNCLPWCSRSPDLNPIENIWGFITQKMYRENFRPQNPDELWDKIQESWELLTVEYTRNLIRSMPTRLNLVLDVNGAAIKY
ncbi:hypothetical protein ABEB36_009535 [Hypothenemus hampei]|uniref:Tc1-like transposase DDE domain-containing protein n=1 Tax=Hypothenemus hampei TaxID=57062 RepID=A0ABD1EH04_HYPHA